MKANLKQYDAKIIVLITEANEEELFNDHKPSPVNAGS